MKSPAARQTAWSAISTQSGLTTLRMLIGSRSFPAAEAYGRAIKGAVRRLVGAAVQGRARQSGSAKAALSLHRNTSSLPHPKWSRSNSSHPELVKSRPGSRTKLFCRRNAPIVWIVREQAEAGVVSPQAYRERIL